MEIYDRVAKVVAPKKAKLKEAQSSLAETMTLLNEKRSELKAVQDRLANLEKTFQEMVDKKKNLEFQVCNALMNKKELWEWNLTFYFAIMKGMKPKYFLAISNSAVLGIRNLRF